MLLLKVPASQAAISHMSQAKNAQLLNHTSAFGGRHRSYSSQWCLRPRPPIKPTQNYRDDPLRSPRSSRKGNNHRRKPGNYSKLYSYKNNDDG